jgi:hypothetical protein
MLSVAWSKHPDAVCAIRRLRVGPEKSGRTKEKPPRLRWRLKLFYEQEETV